MHGQTEHSILDACLQRELRNAPTEAERKLWQGLRGRQVGGFKFRRQHPFGRYILDFVCLERRLVIEVDGGQHLESAGDEQRDAFLAEAGFLVLRFWNQEVLNQTGAVLEQIWITLHERPHPYPNPPLEGEGDMEHAGG